MQEGAAYFYTQTFREAAKAPLLSHRRKVREPVDLPFAGRRRVFLYASLSGSGKGTGSRTFRLLAFDLFHYITLHLIALFNIIEAFKGQTAFKALLNLFDVIFEAFQGGELAFIDYDAVADDADV